MANLNDVCKEVLSEVDGAVGCAVVDLNNGLMLASAHNVPYFSQTYIDAVAAAAVEMFRGKNISAVEKLLAAQRGHAVEKSMQEVQMTTAGTYHFMSVVPGKTDSLMVLITTRKANLGMGWAALRRAMVTAAPMCP
ncbi:MAG: hypothetical protein PSX71_02920 [bacterium]|nr:hypothetical protein [bacterium]